LSTNPPLTHRKPDTHSFQVTRAAAAGRAASTTSTTTAIGILSDTHGVLDAAVLVLLSDRGVRHIVHAGDIGPGRHNCKGRLPAAELLERLAAVAPVSAIAGNVDEEGGKAAAAVFAALNRPPGLQVSTAAVVEYELAGLRFMMSHGHRFPIKPTVTSDGASLTLPSAPANAEAARHIKAAAKPHVIVCGHTHQPVVGRLEGLGDPIVFMNPGSAGPRRFSLPRSFAILSVTPTTVSGARRSRVSVDRFEYRKEFEQEWGVVDTQEIAI
jgi:putative phosphoesterase